MKSTIKFSELFLFLFLSFSLSACANKDSSEQKSEFADTESIVFLHVNDLHGNIDAFPKIAAFVKSVRDTCENVFLLSAGDMFSGNPIVDMHDEPGYPIIDLMNLMDFDLSAIGNHEFDYGQANLNKRILQAQFPFICANIDASSSVLEQPAAYHTFTSKNGYEMVFLSFVETNSKVGDKFIPSTHPEKVQGIHFPYYKTEIKKHTHLKKEDNLFVVLSHLGLSTDEKMAQENDEIDLIIGGHSHSTVTKPQNFNNALICQAGSSGRYVGVVSLLIKEKKVVSQEAYLENMSSYTQTDAEIQEKVESYNNSSVLNKKIGTAKQAIYSKDVLGNLMTDALTWKYDADFAFQNSGGIRSSFAKGDILLKDVYRNDPFGNEVVVFNLSYLELFSLIKNSKPGDLKVSGMHITHQQNGSISLTDYQGKPFDQNKTYKVAMNSYIATSYNFDHTEEGIYTFETSAQALVDYILHLNEVDYKDEKRIFF